MRITTIKQLEDYMKRTIWRYELALKINDRVPVKMPKGAEPIHAENVHGRLCVWAVIDHTQEELSPVIFHLVETGKPTEFYFTWNYLSTVMILGSTLHIFYST